MYVCDCVSVVGFHESSFGLLIRCFLPIASSVQKPDTTKRNTSEPSQFDLVISDLGLPDGNGTEIVLRMRAARIRTPAIAVSGYGMEEDVKVNTHSKNKS